MNLQDCVNSDQKMFVHAFHGNLKECEQLYEQGVDPVVALMGATPRREKDEDNKELQEKRKKNM
jgi:hypothetical protein